MDLLSTAITWALLIFGSTMIIIGGIGVLRLPDFFSRTHGAGLTDTVGAGAVLVGLMFESGFSASTLRLALILLFLWYTSPVGGYALARVALSRGVRPYFVSDSDGERKPKEAGK
jgi:multicomponent Na+:H+ antiporter subunit G